MMDNFYWERLKREVIVTFTVDSSEKETDTINVCVYNKNDRVHPIAYCYDSISAENITKALNLFYSSK